MSIDWASFLLGLSTGLLAEAAVGALITAPLAFWYIKRSLLKADGGLLDQILENDKLVAKLRNKFINAAFGGMGGRAPNLKTMAKATAGVVLQEAMPAIVKRVMTRLTQHPAMRAMGALPQPAAEQDAPK
jgi:hypothetical protein